MPHVADETWATIVASEVWKKAPNRDFDELESLAVDVVRTLRQGRRRVPGRFVGEMMKEIFLGLAKDGYMEEFTGGAAGQVE